jgi:hypothetical protein
MNMKQKKWNPLNTHCGRRDGVCLVMKRTWCFCEFAGGARSDLEPKILEDNWFKLFVEPRTSVYAARPELLFPNLNSLRRICTSSLRRTPASPITGVESSMPNSNKPFTIHNKCDLHMLGSLAEHIKCQSPFVVDIPLRRHRICRNSFSTAHPIVKLNA